MPGSSVTNFVIPGCTDARFFRPKGTIVYGVNLYEHTLDFKTYTAAYHAVNEKISLMSLFMNVQFYALCVKKMLVDAAV